MLAAPDYFCTWLEQGRLWAKENPHCKNPIEVWCVGAPDMLDSNRLFGEGGMALSMPEELRQQLLFMVDSGWDVPYGTPNARDLDFGGLIPDESRFPEVSALKDEVSRLQWLVERIRQCGWRGVGVWVPAHERGQLLEGAAQRDYWRKKIEQSRQAGVNYWKVDWGRRMYDPEFREMLTTLGKEIYPELWIEHALVPPGHLNDGKGEGYFNDRRCLDSARGQLAFADIFRTYDCTWSVAYSVTMGRAATMMQLAEQITCRGRGYLNLESLPMLAMGLGGTYGTMAPPLSSVLPEEMAKQDDSLDNARLGYNEVLCAVNFRRLAAPSPVGMQDVENHISQQWLTDEYDLPPIYGSDAGWVTVRVPSAISRGLPLPEMRALEDAPPMVAATRYPNGVYALAFPPRAVQGKVRSPRSECILTLPEKLNKVGIFGLNGTVKLQGAIPNGEYHLSPLENPSKVISSVIPEKDGTVVMDSTRHGKNLLLQCRA